MITNFEHETRLLTKQEKKEHLPRMLNSFSNKIGKQNAITSTQIIEGFKKHTKLKMSGTRVRKLINHIRCKNLIPCLVGTSKGYWVSKIDSEVESYIKSLKEREEAIHQVRISLAFQLANKKEGKKSF